MTGLFKSFVRITSFVGKELRELGRRPGAIASLIFGPFLVMAIFGIGYRGYRDPFLTEIVTPADSQLPSDPAYYEKLTEGRLHIVRVSHDQDAALDRLGQRQVDFVVSAPPDAAQQLQSGKQSVINVAWNEVDPVADGLAQVAVGTLVHELNAEIIRQAADQGFKAAAAEGADVEQIPPEVIAEPTKAETRNVAPTKPDVLDFFGPAVFALVLQHLAVTLTALSMVRERLGGQMDRFRVSPLNSMELLIGKYFAYAVLSLVVSAAVAGLLVGVLGVPMLGGVLPFAGIVLLLTFASLGVGLLISLIGAAVDAGPAGFGLLLRFRAAGRGVHPAGALPRLHPAGDAWHRDAAGIDAAGQHSRCVDARRAGADRRRPLRRITAPSATSHPQRRVSRRADGGADPYRLLGLAVPALAG
jgi:ABC-2 type transport system permease protein